MDDIPNGLGTVLCINWIGKYTYANGDVYEGQWKNGKKDGKGKDGYKVIGTMNYANGDKYDGQWKDDKKSGLGKRF